MRVEIDYHLEQQGFYIGNPDGEFSEKGWNRVIDEIFDAIQDEKPNNLKSYIKEFLSKNYPDN